MDLEESNPEFVHFQTSSYLYAVRYCRIDPCWAGQRTGSWAARHADLRAGHRECHRGRQQADQRARQWADQRADLRV